MGTRFLLGDNAPLFFPKEEGEISKNDYGERSNTENMTTTRTNKQKILLQEKERMIKEVEHILDVFSDSYSNRHVVYGILELVIMRLFPEMGEMGVKELMEARLGEGWE